MYVEESQTINSFMTLLITPCLNNTRLYCGVIAIGPRTISGPLLLEVPPDSLKPCRGTPGLAGLVSGSGDHDADEPGRGILAVRRRCCWRC